MTGLKFIYFIYYEIVSMIFSRPFKVDYHHDIVPDIFLKRY